MAGIERPLSALRVEVGPFAIRDRRKSWRLDLDEFGFVTVDYCFAVRKSGRTFVEETVRCG